MLFAWDRRYLPSPTGHYIQHPDGCTSVSQFSAATGALVVVPIDDGTNAEPGEEVHLDTDDDDQDEAVELDEGEPLLAEDDEFFSALPLIGIVDHRSSSTTDKVVFFVLILQFKADEAYKEN